MRRRDAVGECLVNMDLTVKHIRQASNHTYTFIT